MTVDKPKIASRWLLLKTPKRHRTSPTKPLPASTDREADKLGPEYYFRPWKTLLVRTLGPGGKSHYVQGDHRETIPALWTAINET